MAQTITIEQFQAVSQTEPVKAVEIDSLCRRFPLIHIFEFEFTSMAIFENEFRSFV